MSGNLADIGVLADRREGDPGLVVVGGGIAALRAVQTVRSEEYEGPVTLVSAETHLPYDRPPLSKQVLTGDLPAHAPNYHNADYFADLNVQLLLGRRAHGLDVDRRRLHVRDMHGREETVPYSAVIIATGARPRQLPYPGPTDGVHVLRTIEDALALRGQLQDSLRVAVVGAGFIGAEVASSARSMGLEVTVIECAPTPLVRAVGESTGSLLAGLHANNDVRLICGHGVTGLYGRERVEAVLLDDGTAVPADLVVMGVGVVPNVEWLVESGLPLGDGLECDEYLQAGRDDVLGAGDAVSWPNWGIGQGSHRMRSQQWTTAGDQGAHAAKVLMRGPDAAGPFRHDMYFWSDQYGVKIQGAGRLQGEATVLEQRSDLTRLVVAYREGDRLGGVLTINHPKEFRRLRALCNADAAWADVAPTVASAPTS